MRKQFRFTISSSLYFFRLSFFVIMILPRKREREMKEGAVFSIREILCPLLIIERAARVEINKNVQINKS